MAILTASEAVVDSKPNVAATSNYNGSHPNDKNKSKKGVKLIFFRLKNYSRILKAA